VAADKNVETARFDGKPVLFARVDDGIHKPEELLKKGAHVKFPFNTPRACRRRGGDLRRQLWPQGVQGPDERRVPHAALRGGRDGDY